MVSMPESTWKERVAEGGWEILDINGEWVPLTANVRPGECRPCRPDLYGYFIRREQAKG